MVKTKKITWMIITILTGAIVLNGCGLLSDNEFSNSQISKSQEEQQSSTIYKDDSAAIANLSDPAVVIGHLVGPEPTGMDRVIASVNEQLNKDLNTSIELHFINWGELSTRYPLILAAGEGVDWIYTANWCHFFSEAPKGAFLELTNEMLQRWMPQHMAVTPSQAWFEAQINGKILMIPTATPDIKYPVMLIREDLRKKYQVPEITRLTDLEPYLLALSEYEPNIIPMNLDNGYDVSTSRYTLMGEHGFLPGVICDGVTYNVEDPTFQVVSYTDEPALSVYKKASNIMKTWYDKQYINHNPFANNIRSKESFQMGQSGVGFGNLYDVDANITVAESLGFEVKVIPLLPRNGQYPRDPYINNGVAIAASSKQPERSMMVLDLLMENADYNMLVTFGIKDVNYTLTDNDMIRLISPAPGESPIYTHTGFWFTNKNQWKPMADWPEQYASLRLHASEYLFDMPLAAYAFYNGDVKVEQASVSSAFKRYGDPLAVGAVSSVDDTIRDLAIIMKEQGIETIKQEAKKQITSFLNEKYIP